MRRARISASSFTSCMVLAHTAIESFTASMAFKLAQEQSRNYDFKKFVKLRGFWSKINSVCVVSQVDSHAEIEPFTSMRLLHKWRNSLIHSAPHRVDCIEIDDTDEVHRLHAAFRDDEFSRHVNEERAQSAFSCAADFVELLENVTGLKPRSFAAYQIK